MVVFTVHDDLCQRRQRGRLFCLCAGSCIFLLRRALLVLTFHRRIQHQLIEVLQLSGRAEVGRCGGEFHDGEFAFTLNVIPSAEGATLDEGTVKEIFQTSTTEIAKVLSSYQFKSFQTVRLILPAMDRNLVLPKTHLQAFQ